MKTVVRKGDITITMDSATPNEIADLVRSLEQPLYKSVTPLTLSYEPRRAHNSISDGYPTFQEFAEYMKQHPEAKTMSLRILLTNMGKQIPKGNVWARVNLRMRRARVALAKLK